MALKILILEDNEERQEAMRACLAKRFYQYEAKFFESAAEMIRYLEDSLDEALAISLDHDLEMKPNPAGGWSDPGTGRDVADLLAGKVPICPVLISTTNVPAAVGMERVLRQARWQTYRVLPFNDLEWVATDWFPTMRRAIVSAAQTTVSSMKPHACEEGSP